MESIDYPEEMIRLRAKIEQMRAILQNKEIIVEALECLSSSTNDKDEQFECLRALEAIRNLEENLNVAGV